MLDIPEDTPIEKLVKMYNKLNDNLKTATAEFATKEKEFKEAMAEVKARLLAHCNEHNVESVRTSEGLFYRTVTTKYWTNNWEEMGKFIVAHNVPELLEKRLHQGCTKQFLEDNPGLLPPGLNIDSTYAITVRKK